MFCFNQGPDPLARLFSTLVIPAFEVEICGQKTKIDITITKRMGKTSMCRGCIYGKFSPPFLMFLIRLLFISPFYMQVVAAKDHWTTSLLR